jgi:hypothetical protein
MVQGGGEAVELGGAAASCQRCAPTTTIDDLGQLLQHREREEEVNHEMKLREGRGCA